MKTRDMLSLAARVIVGAVLIYAGASKAAAPAEEFALVIDAYAVIPTSLTLPMAGLLPWVELIMGWALLLGVGGRAPSSVVGSMFGLFLAALGSVVVRGIPLPNCGCFGDAMHFTPVQAMIFDSTMLALCWAAYRGGSGPLSLDAWSERGHS
jgi:uncharacterized membrane protein YphA (DoxX/SURF4 family)